MPHFSITERPLSCSSSHVYPISLPLSCSMVYTLTESASLWFAIPQKPQAFYLTTLKLLASDASLAPAVELIKLLHGGYFDAASFFWTATSFWKHMRFQASSRHGVRKDIKLWDSIKESLSVWRGIKKGFSQMVSFLAHITWWI